VAPKIENILFASDLTENSRRAFQYAGSMGALYGARITILHVVERLPTGVRHRLALLEGEETLLKLREAHEQQVRNILIGKKRDDGVIRKTLADFYGWSADPGQAESSFKIVLKEGDAAEEIVKAAVNGGCQLIVMGAHTGLWGATALGSVTKRVLHKSKVPVLIVPPPEAG
jgi:nucleotide-binding universal stress UspA family protein